MRVIILLLLLSASVYAADVPKNFITHKDTLVKVLSTSWPDITMPSVVPGLIEQETCYSLTHSKCWSPHAKLETSREYGFGLGQLTVTNRFNTFEEVKVLEPKLKGWKWEDRFNAEFQMIAIAAMLKRNYHTFKDVENIDKYAFSLASYNGGLSGILADQKICKHTPGCNPVLWFNNVEHTSLKKRTKVTGYGKSFFEINREYPKNILEVRRFKYKPYVDPEFKNVAY
jgi:hypothetical protein